MCAALAFHHRRYRLEPAWLRLAYAFEFMIALLVAVVLWTQAGGQGHLDLMPWYIKRCSLRWGSSANAAGSTAFSSCSPPTRRPARRRSRGLILEAAPGPSRRRPRPRAERGRRPEDRAEGRRVYRLDVEGRAAHAGLDPRFRRERGRRARPPAAGHRGAGRSRPRGTTVNPGIVSAGTAVNTVPAVADRTDRRSDEHARRGRPHRRRPPRSAAGVTPGAAVSVERISVRSPAGANLVGVAVSPSAEELADRLGLPPLTRPRSGVGPTGTYLPNPASRPSTASARSETHAHARGEYVRIGAMPERAALVAALVRACLSQELLVGAPRRSPPIRPRERGDGRRGRS